MNFNKIFLLKKHILRNRLILYIVITFISLSGIYGQSENLFIGVSDHEVVEPNYNDTQYYKVGPFGWLGTIIFESHDEFYYPTINDYQPPGYYSINGNGTALGDFNSDGKQDLVITWNVTPHTIERQFRIPTFTVLLNNGDGSLKHIPEIFEDEMNFNTFSAHRTIVTDFNSDGKPDIIASSQAMIKRNADGTYTTKHDPIPLALSTSEGKLKDATANIEGQEDKGVPVGYEIGHDLSAGDVNGDGFPDVYTGKVLLLNNGSGVFKNATDFLPQELKPSPGYIMSSAIGDLNNDGVGDIISAHSDGSPVSGYILLSRNGDINFENRELIQLPGGRFGVGNTKFNYVILHDVDSDGLLDIVFSVTRSNPYYTGLNIQLIMNKGDGVFVDETETRVNSPDYLDNMSGGGILSIADANNDGISDIIQSGVESVIYINKGGNLEVFDRERYAFLQRWQIKGSEGYKEFYLQDVPNQSFPIDLDGKGGVDFISYLEKAKSGSNTPEPTETVFYSILSRLDTDNDVVIDDIDTCPDTPEGEEVDENGCTSNQLSVVDEILNNTFQLYPNPVTNILTIESKNFQIIKVEFFNLFGKKVKEVHSGFETIKTDNLSNGMYLIKISSKKNMVMRKILKI